MGNSDETSTPNNAGSSKEAANRTKYESYKQELNAWYQLLGEDTLNPNIKLLNEMSKGMDEMKNGLDGLIDDEFEIDLTKHRDIFNRAKAQLNGALREYKENKNKMTTEFYYRLETCRDYIKDFIRQLAAEEAFSASEDLENPGEAQLKKFA